MPRNHEREGAPEVKTVMLLYYLDFLSYLHLFLIVFGKIKMKKESNQEISLSFANNFSFLSSFLFSIMLYRWMNED